LVRRFRPQTPPDAEVVEPEVLAVLAGHHWPGNVRELAKVIEHALVLCDELPLRVEHLPARLGGLKPKSSGAQATVPGPCAAVGAPPAVAMRSPRAAAEPGWATAAKPVSLRELEMQAIHEGLKRNQGNKARTAEDLGISLKTLYNKLHQLQETIESQERERQPGEASEEQAKAETARAPAAGEPIARRSA